MLLTSRWGKFPSVCPENDLRGSSPPHTASANQPTPSHEPSGTFCLPTSLLSCHHFSRCHLIGLLRCDITGGQLREESGQPVLWFSSCLRVQPGQALFQQVILETWDGGRGWCTLQLQRSPTCVKFSECSLQSVYRYQTQDYLMTFNAEYFWIDRLLKCQKMDRWINQLKINS